MEDRKEAFSLFDIEFSLDKLARLILIGGGMQVVLSVLVVMGVLLLYCVPSSSAERAPTRPEPNSACT